ncbi:MAG: IclR family transcriptional regulator [Lachnospiraceae bacterium]|nr:IclR family transcriptional regulator [Lachnospiraceae bacterium]
MEEKTDSKNVKSIEKAFRILMLFDWDNRELSLTEVSQKMGMAKSTASRLLGTLVNLGFLYRSQETNRYLLGSEIFYLGQIARDSSDLTRLCLPVLQNLTKETRETSHVYIYRGMDRICLEQVESPQVIKQSVQVGSVEPLWKGASGYAILAFLEEGIQERAAVLQYGENEREKINAFLRSLAKIRREGIAVRHDTWDGGVGCIAAPIFDMYGRIAGSLAVSTPAFRFPEDSHSMEQWVWEGAMTLSRQLGYRE